MRYIGTTRPHYIKMGHSSMNPYGEHDWHVKLSMRTRFEPRSIDHWATPSTHPIQGINQTMHEHFTNGNLLMAIGFIGKVSSNTTNKSLSIKRLKYGQQNITSCEAK